MKMPRKGYKWPTELNYRFGGILELYAEDEQIRPRKTEKPAEAPTPDKTAEAPPMESQIKPDSE